jgi:hypothetical protein
MSKKISLVEILSLTYLSKMISKRKAELLTDTFFHNYFGKLNGY